MSITSNITDNKLTLNVSGQFDFSAHKEFRIATDLVTANTSSIYVDMRTTDYIDSSALGMLLILRDKMGGQKDAVTIANAKPEVKNVLRIANFDQLFNLV